MRSHFSKNAFQSKKFQEKKKNRAIKLASISLVVIFVWTFVSIRIFGLSFINIDNVQIFGADPDSVRSMQAASMKALEGKYLGVVPKSNVFFYPKDEIIDLVRESTYGIESVTVKKSNFRTLAVSVNGKPPAAIVCPAFPDLSRESSDELCYFADRDGYIFKVAPDVSGHAFPRLYIPTLANGTTSPIGKFATSTHEYASLLNLFKDVQKAGMESRAILFKEKGEYELFLSGDQETEELTTVIYFNNRRSFEDQLVNLVSFWKKMKENKKQKPEFEYIDVRYGSNVFYRASR